jgi:hypothetical protein
MGIFFSSFRGIRGISGYLFDCSVHDVPFKCLIPNSKFFLVVYTLAITLIFAYVACTLYCLAWLLHRNVAKLEKVLSGQSLKFGTGIGTKPRKRKWPL